jgi:hypothetical protein
MSLVTVIPHKSAKCVRRPRQVFSVRVCLDLPGAGSLPVRATPESNRQGELQNKPAPDEEQRILNSPPTGTFALMLLVGALIVAGWAYMFFSCFWNMDR